MLSSFINDDFTGTIITSDKPLSVFSGFATLNAYIEQIPPHPTYGNLFFLQPTIQFLESGYFRIGSVNDEAFIQINCPCEPGSVTNNRLSLSGSGRFFTVVINRGQYVECRTPSSHVLCSVQSTRPVSVMTYTGDSMVYIPPVDSYLTQYSVTSLDDSPVYLSYTLQDLISPGLLVNRDEFPPFDNFTTVDCRLDCFESMVCGRGATGYLGRGTFDIQFSGNVPFWGYSYSFGSFAYPLPFGMRPIGCKFYTVSINSNQPLFPPSSGLDPS